MTPSSDRAEQEHHLSTPNGDGWRPNLMSRRLQR
jgi:hypothetical protein